MRKIMYKAKDGNESGRGQAGRESRNQDLKTRGKEGNKMGQEAVENRSQGDQETPPSSSSEELALAAALSALRRRGKAEEGVVG